MDKGMISSSIRLKIQSEKIEIFESLVSQLVQDIHKNEPGAHVYEVRRVVGEPLTYLYFMSFEDEESHARYLDAPYHTEMSPKAMECLDGDPVFEDLESFY